VADRILLESGTPDGILLEDGSGVIILEFGIASPPFIPYFERKLPQSQRFKETLYPNLALQQTDTTTNRRASVTTGLPKVGKFKETLYPNLVINTTVTVTQAPFVNLDFGKTIQARISKQDVYPNIALLTPIVIEVLPFQNLDWPKTRQGKFTNVDYPNNLLNYPTPEVPPPFPNLDWPKTLVARFESVDYPNLVINLPVEQMPIQNTDWPETRVQRYQSVDYPNLVIQVQVVQQSPFVNPDWPRLKYKQSFDTTQYPNILILQYVSTPFNNVDFGRTKQQRVVLDWIKTPSFFQGINQVIDFNGLGIGSAEAFGIPTIVGGAAPTGVQWRLISVGIGLSGV
jgi:hypothetical protein